MSKISKKMARHLEILEFFIKEQVCESNEELFKFIRNTICTSNEMFDIIAQWLDAILKRKTYPTLISLNNSTEDIEKFLLIILKALNRYKKPIEYNYLIIDKLDEVQCSEFSKYILIIFNGFQVDEVLLFSNQEQLSMPTWLRETNILISINKFNSIELNSNLKSNNYN